MEMPDSYLTEILFRIYQAGENKGKELNWAVKAEENEQREDFFKLCEKEIRQIDSAFALNSLRPEHSKEVRDKIQQEAWDSGLMNVLFSLIK